MDSWSFELKKHGKFLFKSSIFLSLVISYNVVAAPLTELSPHIQGILSEKLGNSYQGYSNVDHLGTGGLYIYHDGMVGGSNWQQSTIPVFGDNLVIRSPSNMGHGILINNRDAPGTSVGTIVGNGLDMDIGGLHNDGLRSWGGNSNNPNNPNFIIVGDDAKIVVRGSSGDAINAGWTRSGITINGSAIIDVGDNARLETHGAQGRGISAYNFLTLGLGANNINEVTLGDNAKIFTYGAESEGIRVNGSKVFATLGKGAYIETHGTILTATELAALKVEDSSFASEGHGSYGLLANSGSHITLGENSGIQTFGKNSHGVVASDSGTGISLGKDIIIKTNATDNTNGVNVTSSAQVTFESGATIHNAGTKADNSYALNAAGGGINGSTLGNYQIVGDINASGSSTANAGKINLNMDVGSRWTGASYLSGKGATDIAMKNSIWNMTGSSQLTSLNNLESTVNFQSSLNNFYTLSTGSLSGSGAFAMKVDMVGLQGDLLKVTGSNVVGSHALSIANVGSAQTNGNELLTVVETLDNTQGSFTSNIVEAGGFEYQLRQKDDGKGWELYSIGISADTGSKTTTADASVNLLNANYLLSYIDTQTLLQRMGELRKANEGQQQGDFWLRGFTGKLNSFGGSSVSDFDMSYKGTQAGIDKLINVGNNRFYVGAMVGFTDADPDYRGGRGTNKDYHAGLYSAYVTDNGFYVDGVLKYTHMKNRFNVKDTLGSSITGKGSSSGYSASIEVGKRIRLSGDGQSGGYFIEPQTQLTYGYQGGMTVNGSNGLKTKLSNYNFALGRASTLVGYTVQGTNPIDLYVKTGYVREMAGKTSYRFNGGDKIKHSFHGGWWDNGIGVNAQINSKHNVHADINYAVGNRFDQKQLNVGYRYSF